MHAIYDIEHLGCGLTKTLAEKSSDLSNLEIYRPRLLVANVARVLGGVTARSRCWTASSGYQLSSPVSSHSENSDKLTFGDEHVL